MTMIIQDFLISHWCPSLYFSFLFHSTCRQEMTQEKFTKLSFYPSPSLITKRMSQSFLSWYLGVWFRSSSNFLSSDTPSPTTAPSSKLIIKLFIMKKVWPVHKSHIQLPKVLNPRPKIMKVIWNFLKFSLITFSFLKNMSSSVMYLKGPNFREK